MSYVGLRTKQNLGKGKIIFGVHKLARWLENTKWLTAAFTEAHKVKNTTTNFHPTEEFISFLQGLEVQHKNEMHATVNRTCWNYCCIAGRGSLSIHRKHVSYLQLSSTWQRVDREQKHTARSHTVWCVSAI